MAVWRVRDRDVLEHGQVLLPSLELVPSSEGTICGWVLFVRCSTCGRHSDTAILVEEDGGRGDYPREVMELVARILARRGHGVAGRSHRLSEPELARWWMIP